MGRLDKLASWEGSLQLGERLLHWGPLVIGTGGAAWLGGWATAATSAFGAYSPASWVFGGLLGAGLFALVVSLWTSARTRMVRLKFASAMSEKPPTVNPLDGVFTKQRISADSFRNHFNEPVEGKTFVDCELIGPAVIFLADGISMAGVGIAACEFIRVRDGAAIYNAMPWQHITVTRGKLRGLTLLVPQSAVAKVDAGVAGIQWITH